jgi:hypothetical protein
VNGVKNDICFGLFYQSHLFGAMILGQPATRQPKYRYGKNSIEIRRLVCVDDTPKNTESCFIGYVLRWLRKYTAFDTVIAYADLQYGHKGTVYAASNFRKVAFITGAVKIEWQGKLYHDRSMRVCYNGRLKPFAAALAKAHQNGQTRTVQTKHKIVWVYYLKR